MLIKGQWDGAEETSTSTLSANIDNDFTSTVQQVAAMSGLQVRSERHLSVRSQRVEDSDHSKE